MFLMIKESPEIVQDIVLQPAPPQVLVMSADDIFKGQDEREHFTQHSNERFYSPTEAELEFIASQATAQSAKDSMPTIF